MTTLNTNKIVSILFWDIAAQVIFNTGFLKWCILSQPNYFQHVQSPILHNRIAVLNKLSHKKLHVLKSPLTLSRFNLDKNPILKIMSKVRRQKALIVRSTVNGNSNYPNCQYYSIHFQLKLEPIKFKINWHYVVVWWDVCTCRVVFQYKTGDYHS